jgi:hypothetical protein
MDIGGPRSDYWRMSVAGKGAVTMTGTLSNDPNLTHHSIGLSALGDVLRVFSLITGGWR